jgi:hypothetical protein
LPEAACRLATTGHPRYLADERGFGDHPPLLELRGGIPETADGLRPLSGVQQDERDAPLGADPFGFRSYLAEEHQSLVKIGSGLV